MAVPLFVSLPDRFTGIDATAYHKKEISDAEVMKWKG